MTPFRSIEIVPSYYEGDAVSWTLDPAFSDLAPFVFTLETSEVPDFSTVISSVVSASGTFAIDTSRQRQTLTPNYYFRVKLETGSGKTYYSPIQTYSNFLVGPHKYWLTREIVRREYVRFKHVGLPGMILKRKNYGERHPTATMPLSGVSMVETDPVIGTEFEGGYHNSFPIQFSFETGNTFFESNSAGLGVDNLTTYMIRLPGFPSLQTKDVLVANHARYNLEKVNKTYMPGTGICILQTAEAKLLPATDPVYRVPVVESHFKSSYE